MTLPKCRKPFKSDPKWFWCQIKQIVLKAVRLEGNVTNFIFKGGGGRERASEDWKSLVAVSVNHVFIWDL